MEERRMDQRLAIGLGFLLVVALATMVACEEGMGGPTPTRAEIAEEAAREFGAKRAPAIEALAGDPDVDGVVIVPADKLDAVVESVREIRRQEAEVEARVKAGLTYPESWRAYLEPGAARFVD